MIRLLVTSLCLTVWLSVAVSQPLLLGTFDPIFHETSGILYAIDENTFFIQNFEYDGQGVVVYIYVYLNGQAVRSVGGGTIINWSPTRQTVPQRRFRSENITLSLSANTNAHLKVSDIGTFTVWCQPFAVFFTRLDLPINVSIPTGGPTGIPMVPSCIQLHNGFQVFWSHADHHIKIKQCGCIGEDQYMAFGISGSNTSTNMAGADVVVTWINNDGPKAVDYYLTDRQQCRAGQGVCPDTMISGGIGSQDVVNVTGDVVNGMRCIEYTRLLTTDDSNDRPYLVNNQTQFVVWALGPRATEEGLKDLAFFHTEFPRNGADVQVDFAQKVQCNEPLQCIPEEICGWEGLYMTAIEPTTFTVKIGLSGGLRGYQSITGLSGWGIAYYINDTLAPVLRLRRNVTYTFIVEAGNNANDTLRYHPFYITDSIDGGILLDTPEDRARKNEQVYAGYNAETYEPTAAGRYCAYEETAQSKSIAMDCNSSLQDYLDTLSVSCQGDESEAAILTWTPNENTPDVVYYQCANHLHLGWQIELMNETATEIRTSTNSNSGGGSAIFVIIGSVGGTVSVFICLICFVIIYVYIRHYYNKKKTHIFDKRVDTELSLDVVMNTNPSYNTHIEQNQEHLYDYVLRKEYLLQENTQDIVKMECDPAYGGIQDCNAVVNLPKLRYNNDATIHPNSSHSSNLETFKTSDIVKMECDPAYGRFQACNAVVNLPKLEYNSDTGIHPNPSHSSNLETFKTSEGKDEDQHDYFEADLHNTVQGVDCLHLMGSTTKSVGDIAVVTDITTN